MTANESHSSDPFSGIPEVTPSMIRAYKQLPDSFNDQFHELKRDNPELAKEIFIDAHNSSPNDIERKRAYAAGALFMYGLIKFDRQYTLFESLMQEATGDDVGDEAPQL